MAEHKAYFVEFRGDIAILWMNDLENRYNLSTVKEIHSELDKIESNKDVKFLVTIGKGKYFSNGLDLDKIVGYNKHQIEEFRTQLSSLFMRLLMFPIPTIAALNGHAYAAGGLFALSHDYRIMRTKQGWFCLPEVNLRLRFSPLMISLAKAKILDPRVRTDVLIMGKKYTAEQALEARIVDQICDNRELLNKAIDFGRSVVGKNNWDRTHVANLKKDLYWEVLDYIERMNVDLKPLQDQLLSKL